jgi:RNA polymerase sigma-70 factor (ECF subfamily)
MGDVMEAEDVMIEGFMRIFDKISQFNFKGSFEGWMRRIMVNEALMRLRGKKMINVELDEVRQESSGVSVESNINAEELLKLVNELPVGYRTVLTCLPLRVTATPKLPSNSKFQKVLPNRN